MVGDFNRAVDIFAGMLATEAPVIELPPPGVDGKWTLEVSAPVDVEAIVETTTDLNGWTEIQRVKGQGAGKPVRVTVTPQTGEAARFWRARSP